MNFLPGNNNGFTTLKINDDWGDLSDEQLEEVTLDLTDRVNGKPVTAYHYSIPQQNWTPSVNVFEDESC